MGEKRLLELKTRCRNLSPAATWCAQHATPIEDVRQADTYFHVRQGRLKLRVVEGRDEGTLIYYQREDTPDPKRSRVSLLPVSEPGRLLDLLGEALGVLVRVQKRRRIYRWGMVQIHLDEVASLGSFIEFERFIHSQRDEMKAQAEFDELRTALAVGEEDLVAGSYSDAILDLDSRAGRT
ncbi:MAG: CYTH domain-containing protein [Thermoplasmata archaeon]